MADAKGLDLVEVSAQSRPPVCRIMDFGKYKYEEGKKKKAAKKGNRTAGKVKEVKFHANVAENDFQTKIRHARAFLEDGHRLKLSLYFRGRENAHRELGFDVVNKAIEAVSDIGTADQLPKLVGRSVVAMVAPRSSKSGANE